MKYGFRPRDCPRAPPLGNSSGENHISWYVPPLVNVLLQSSPLTQLTPSKKTCAQDIAFSLLQKSRRVPPPDIATLQSIVALHQSAAGLRPPPNVCPHP